MGSLIMNVVPYFTVTIPTLVCTVQLKGNLTHADGAHAIYWLKTRSFINLYWHVWKGKPAKTNF